MAVSARRLLFVLPALAAAGMLCACATRTVEPGVDRTAVSRVVGDVMSAQVRIGTDEKLGALRDLQDFLTTTDLRNERVAKALTQLADLYLTIELNTYARQVRVSGPETARVHHDRSIPLYKKVLADYPKRPRNQSVYYQLARAYDDLGDYAAERKMLNDLVEKAPGGPRLAEAHYRLGELAFDDGRFGDAAADYQAALKAGAEGRLQDFATYKRVWALYLMPDPGAAQAAVDFLDLKRVPRGGGMVLDSQSMPEPDWERVMEIVLVLARVLHDQGGVPALERLFAHERDYVPMVYRQLGEVSAQMGDTAAGIATFDAFIRRHPDSPRVPDFLGYMVDLYTDDRNVAKAVAVRERMVRDYGPKSAWWAHQAASVRRQMGPVVRQTALDLARHHHSVAQKTKKPADYAKAVAAYRTYLAGYPESPEAPEAAFLLGEILFDSGDYGGAAAAYRKAAYDYPVHRKSGEAAYAAVFARERQLEKTPKSAPAYAETLGALATDFMDLVRSYPREPRLAAAYGRVSGLLFEQKDFARLYDVSDQVIRYGPRSRDLHVKAWRSLGEAALEMGRLDQADTALSQALAYLKDDPAQAEQAAELTKLLAASAVSRADAPGVTDAEGATWLLKAAALVPPDDPLASSARVDAGLAYIRAGDGESALATFQAYLADHPKTPGQSPDMAPADAAQRDRVAQAVLQLGQDALSRGDAPAARMAWDRYLTWFAGEWPERDRAIAGYQARTDLAAGDLEAADRSFTALVQSYPEGTAPQEDVDRLAGIRFKRAAALLAAGNAAGLDLLAGIADRFPNSALAPKALEAERKSAAGVGKPERAVIAAELLAARYPGSGEADAADAAYPDLLLAAGRDLEAAAALTARANEVAPSEAPVLLDRAAGIYEANGDKAGAADTLRALRDREEPGSDPWVAAELRIIALEVAGHSRPPENGWPKDTQTALDARLLEVVTPMADGDALGPDGRQRAAQIWLERADRARAAYDAVRLEPPFKQNLAAKQAALKETLEDLGRAAAFRSRDATLAATRRTGDVLEDFAHALLDAPVPAELTEAQAGIYREALAKRAAPYLQRAIEAHARNLERAREGLLSPDVEASLAALGRLRPEWYDRPELGVRPVDVR